MALSDQRNTPRKLSGYDLVHNFECASGTTIYKGGLTAVVAGKCQPAGATGAGAVVGRAKDNTGGGAAGVAAEASGTRLDVEQGIFKWDSGTGSDAITASAIGDTCFALDDHTVGAAGVTGSMVAGTVIDIDSDGGVWVLSTLDEKGV
jgi:hypothetical protein